MYTPAYFKADDPAQLAAMMRRHSFATLVTSGERGLFATHVPFLYDAEPGPHGVLLTHLARANPQWQEFAAGREVMVIFQGEHGYISPSWYVSAGPSVPTWNYEAVHAHGVPRILEEARAADLLLRTVAHYERPGSGYAVPPDFLQKSVKAIVALEIPVARLEGKFKLSQNRSAEDVQAAIHGLEDGGEPAALRLAAAIRRANGLSQTSGM